MNIEEQNKILRNELKELHRAIFISGHSIIQGDNYLIIKPTTIRDAQEMKIRQLDAKLKLVENKVLEWKKWYDKFNIIPQSILVGLLEENTNVNVYLVKHIIDWIRESPHDKKAKY